MMKPALSAGLTAHIRREVRDEVCSPGVGSTLNLRRFCPMVPLRRATRDSKRVAPAGLGPIRKAEARTRAVPAKPRCSPALRHSWPSLFWARTPLFGFSRGQQGPRTLRGRPRRDPSSDLPDPEVRAPTSRRAPGSRLDRGAREERAPYGTLHATVQRGWDYHPTGDGRPPIRRRAKAHASWSRLRDPASTTEEEATYAGEVAE